MSIGARFPIELVPRRTPLQPVAVVGLGPVARALAQHLLRRPAAQLAELRGVVSAELLAVLGAPEALPWVDGVAYFGRDEAAPRLLLPTTLAPSVSAALLERALLAAHRELFAPLLVMATPRRVLSLATALPIEAARLTSWLEAGMTSWEDPP